VADGLLKKRVKDRIKWYPVTNQPSETGISEQAIRVDFIEQILEEAKKDFPNHDTEGFDELLYLHEEQEEWFEKWFGQEGGAEDGRT
jgi:hypothetical protein